MRKFFTGAPATAVISALCVGVFAVSAAQARSLSDVIWSSPLGSTFVLWGPFVSGGAGDFGWARSLTSGFLHVDVSHLAINLFMLVLIGSAVERYVGTPAFVLSYLAGVLGGSAAVLAFAYEQPTAGASGALYALMAILVAIAGRSARVSGSRTDLRAPLVLVLGNLVFTLLVPGVSLWGHLGGLAAGAAMAWPLTSPDPKLRRVTAQVGLGLACTAVGAAVVLGPR